MRKFRAVFKEKQSLAENLQEKKVLGSFTKVYNALLEKYSISNFNSLDEMHQNVFLAELNSYWDEKEGILPKGKKFLQGNSDILNESSTNDQKKNFMRKRAIPAISETFRQSNLKYKLYNIIDEMYKGVGAQKLGDVMDPKEMTEILVESFKESVKQFMTEVKWELSENAKETPSKQKKTKVLREGILNPLKAKKINFDCADPDVCELIVSWLEGIGIESQIDENGYIKDKDHNVMGTITTEGYIYIPGFGNWAPDELGDEKSKILTGLKANSDMPYSY